VNRQHRGCLRCRRTRPRFLRSRSSRRCRSSRRSTSCRSRPRSTRPFQRLRRSRRSSHRSCPLCLRLRPIRPFPRSRPRRIPWSLRSSYRRSRVRVDRAPRSRRSHTPSRKRALPRERSALTRTVACRSARFIEIDFTDRGRSCSERCLSDEVSAAPATERRSGSSECSAFPRVSWEGPEPRATFVVMRCGVLRTA
jgi:hypothetical protein